MRTAGKISNFSVSRWGATNHTNICTGRLWGRYYYLLKYGETEAQGSRIIYLTPFESVPTHIRYIPVWFCAHCWIFNQGDLRLVIMPECVKMLWKCLTFVVIIWLFGWVARGQVYEPLILHAKFETSVHHGFSIFFSCVCVCVCVYVLLLFVLEDS
jgi:hypothetical protein